MNDKANNEDILNGNNIEDLYIAPFFDSDNNLETSIYISNDGVNFSESNKIGGFRDCDIIFFKDRFYCLATQVQGESLSDFILLESDNLKDWKKYYIDVGLRDSTYFNVWAPEWFIDGEKLYITISKRIGTITDSENGKEYYKFKPYLIEIIDLQNHIFNTPSPIELDDLNRIDGHIIKKEDSYYLFIKKEGTEGTRKDGSIEIWNSHNLKDWTLLVNSIESLSEFKVEAPSVEKISDTYFLYFDDYYGSLGSNVHYCTSNDLINWSIPKKIVVDKLTRHGSVRKITNVVGKNIIKNIPLKTQKSYSSVKTTTININKYFELFEIQLKTNCNTCSCSFKFSDSQNFLYDIDFNLTVQRGSNGNDVVAFNAINIYKNKDILNKLYLINIGDCKYKLLFKDDIGYSTPTISFSNINSNFEVALKSDIIYSSIPSGTISKPIPFIGNTRQSCIFETKESDSVSFSFISNHYGIVKIYGHGNSTETNKIIDYDVALIGSWTNSIKRLSDGLDLTISIVYSSGKYTMNITTGIQYSVLDISIPSGAYFI